MSKKERTLKSLLIALAPNIVGMGIYQATVNSEPVQGALLIAVGVVFAVGYEILQEKQIKINLPDSITPDLVEGVIENASATAADDIEKRWDAERNRSATQTNGANDANDP